jgi:AIPR protein
MRIGSKVTRDDLQEQLDEFKKTFKLRDDDAFVAWFMRAYIVESDATAKDSLTGDSGERGIDAVYIDDSVRTIHIVQGKYHNGINQARDSEKALSDFASWAEILYSPAQEFASAIAGIEPIADKKLKEAHERLGRADTYRLVFYWVSTGRASSTAISAAEQIVRRAGAKMERTPRFEYVGGQEVLDLLRDYLYGVAPAVPMLELPAATDIVLTRDEATGIMLRMFQMQGDDLGALVDAAGVQLFALNIRSYLHDTKVNKNLKKTLREAPQNFLYFNNGVTFVCDSARLESADERSILTVTNPQIINGQQTTRVLHEIRDGARKARVLVRVMVIPRDREDAEKRAEMVSDIVQATNWQNSIKLSDLKANDIRQVVIERGMRREGNYYYSRKTESLRDIKAKVGKGIHVIRRADLADAVAGCTIPGLPVQGKEVMFDEYYDRIFDAGQTIKEYLCCYWFMRSMKAQIRGSEVPVEEKRGQWLALYHAYKELRPRVGKRTGAFIAASEDFAVHEAVIRPFDAAMAASVRSVARFYRQTRNRDGLPYDPTNFFKTKMLYPRFERFWPTAANATLRTQFEKEAMKFERLLKAAEI